MTAESPDTPPSSGERGPHRAQRLSELRHDLHRGRPARRSYARNTLLALLWVEEGLSRLAVLCALCDLAPGTGKAEAPPFLGRLATRLSRGEPNDDLAPPPAAAQLHTWIGRELTAVLTESLDRLKSALRTAETLSTLVQQEAEVCLQALALARLLSAEETAEPCVRLLRLLPSAQPSTPLLSIRQIGDLRDSACAVLGSLSPDALFPLWSALGGPEATIRQDLLPVLDYLRDARAVPYLIRLAERRSQWTDGEIVGWFLVRAFERIGDKGALPALRRIAQRSQPLRSLLPALRSLERAEAGTSPELAREAQRVIQAIEQGKEKRERNVLLRPAPQPTKDLLLPAEETPYPDENDERDTLLRPDLRTDAPS